MSLSSLWSNPTDKFGKHAVELRPEVIHKVAAVQNSYLLGTNNFPEMPDSETKPGFRPKGARPDRMPMTRGDITVDPHMPMYNPQAKYGTRRKTPPQEPDCPVPPLSDYMPVEKQPIPVKQVRAAYPEAARRARIEGTVWIKVFVDKEGNVKKASVLKSDSEVLNQPAIDAAKSWKFKPAMSHNEPVSVWAALPFHFKPAK